MKTLPLPLTPDGTFPDVHWIGSMGYVVYHDLTSGSIVVEQWRRDAIETRLRIWSVSVGRDAQFPRLGDSWSWPFLVYREGLRGRVVNLTTGEFNDLGEVYGNACFAFGASLVVWQEVDGVHGRDLGSWRDLGILRRETRPTGISRLVGTRVVFTDEDRLRVDGMVNPVEAGALTIGENPADFGAFAVFRDPPGRCIIWPTDRTFTPRAAEGPDGLYACAAWGAPAGVRLALITRADAVTQPTDPPSHPTRPPMNPQPLPGPTDMLRIAYGPPDAALWPRGAGMDLQVDWHARRATWVKGGKGAFEAWSTTPIRDCPDGAIYLIEDHSDESAGGYGLTPGILYPLIARPGQVVRVRRPAWKILLQPDGSFNLTPDTPRGPLRWWYDVSFEWIPQYPVPGYGVLDLVRTRRQPVNEDGSPQLNRDGSERYEFDYGSPDVGRVGFETARGDLFWFPPPTPTLPRPRAPQPILSFPPPFIPDPQQPEEPDMPIPSGPELRRLFEEVDDYYMSPEGLNRRARGLPDPVTVHDPAVWDWVSMGMREGIGKVKSTIQTFPEWKEQHGSGQPTDPR